MVGTGETRSSSGCLDELEDLLGVALEQEACAGERRGLKRRGLVDDDDAGDLEASSRSRPRSRACSRSRGGTVGDGRGHDDRSEGQQEREPERRDGGNPIVASSDQTHTLNVTDLPQDCLEKIVTRLSPADLLSLSCACTTFKRLCSSQPLWRCLYYERWPSGRRVLDGIKLASHEDDGVDITSWKDLYIREDAGELEELVGGASTLFVEMAKGWREVAVRDWDSEEVCVVHQSSMVLPGTENVRGGGHVDRQQASFRGSSERLARYMAEHNIPTNDARCGAGEGEGEEGEAREGERAKGSARHECAFDKIGHTAYVCRVCGRLHRCDGSCAYVRRMGNGNDGDGLAEVCTLTGVMREMAFVVDGDGDGGAGEADNQVWDKRALFKAGYEADEDELLEKMLF